MSMFNISMVLGGVSLTDDVAERTFAVLPDALLSEVSDAVTVTAPVAGPDARRAAFVLIDALERALPEARCIRLDQDLVAIPDIADRSGRSRESVRLLVEGKRGPGRFPVPVGTVGDGIRVWPWAMVLDWFAGELGEDLGEHGISPEDAAAIDATLAARRVAIA